MKVILKQDVEMVGKAGEMKNVADGYARNFLVPRGLAVLATSRSIAEVEHRKRMVEAKMRSDLKDAEALKDRLGQVACKIAREVGEEERLFGSVTNRDIAEALNAAGIEIDHRKIVMSAPLKHLGAHEVSVRLSAEVTAVVKVWVVAK